MLVSPADVVAKAKATIKECSVRDVRDCLNEGTVLIDIRERTEYQRGHLPGAMIIPRGLLEFEIIPALERLGTDTPVAEHDIVLYCGTGGRSALAAKSLDAMGFRNVKSMDGGIVAWAEAKLPLVTPTA
ncbi:MAG: rhodanese-like domain-containing protein [Gammaproteobacteria bacterium]|nr:rhodanese-like domain-containing protein [Gammaproteobacteria bacterium]MDH5617167.1 rhodanese-like domain-containing protein [Gammaproteobacteria bacterium]